MGGDIVLTNTLEISPGAKTVRNYDWTISNDQIVTHLNYYDVTGTMIVKQETFEIKDDDFTPLANAVVQQAHVGQKFIDIIEKAIRNKIKTMKGWTGTVT